MKSNRILVIDALRGFSLFAILLLHSIEHFGIFGQAIQTPAFLMAFDQLIEKILFFIFSGKAYSIFALLMGVSFWLQYEKHKNTNVNFALRYSWRLILLLIFGIVHTAFYSGDILVLYAITGFILVFTRNFSNRLLLSIAILLLAEPLGLYRCLSVVFQNDIGIPEIKIREFYKEVKSARMNGSFQDLIYNNLKYGIKGNNSWNWEHGRVSQTPGLFLIGVLLARLKIFHRTDLKFWLKGILASIIIILSLYVAEYTLNSIIEEKLLQKHLLRVLMGYKNMAFTTILISLFVLSWNTGMGNKRLTFLIPYGKFSLTNYIFQGIIGVFVFQNVGLRLFTYTGPTLAVVTGVIIFFIQLKFSHWWLKKYNQGPLEFIWRKLTWMSAKS